MRSRRVTACVFLCVFGVFGLLHIIGHPRLQTLHNSDVLQLIASAGCFGVGFGLLLGKRRFPGE